ncbi:outer membrane protein [Labrys neptuniae]
MKFRIASAALFLVTTSAYAADLAPQSIEPAPPIFAPSWTGFYAGINAGYTWSNSNKSKVDTTGTTLVPAGFSIKNDGVLGGAQVGYNYAFTNGFVIGVEADLQGTNAHEKKTASSTAQSVTSGPGFVPAPIPDFPPLPGIVTTTSTSSTAVEMKKRLSWLGTIRGRVGYLATPNLLVYGTAGLAYGKVSASTNIAETLTQTTAFIPNFVPPLTVTSNGSTRGSYDKTKFGWTIGGGVEWMFAANWSVKAEYLYYNLGKARYAQAAGLAGSSQQTTHVKFDGQIARVGLNYHF